MKLSAFLLGVVSAPVALGHYTFSGLIVNGKEVGKEWQYVRQHQNGYMPTKFKNAHSGSISPLDKDFTCNKGASSGANTQVYTVRPGDKVAMKQAFGAGGMEHPGPTQVYISKARGDVKSYSGDGDWYKLHQSLVCIPGSAESLRSTAWCMWKTNSIGATIPSNIAPGEYLFRVEHIALHGAHGGEAEFYYSCAQLKVEGGSGSNSSGNGLSGTSAKIPGLYSANDPAVNFSLWGKSTCYDKMPGPKVISGGTTEGSACGNGVQRSVRAAKAYVGGISARAMKRYLNSGA